MLNMDSLWNLAYIEFIDLIPQSWKPWFTSNKLMAISCRYGQNIAIESSANLTTQREEWKRYHRFADMRFITFALAADCE